MSALSSLTCEWFQTLALAFLESVLCIFWGAILKMAGYMMGGVPGHMGSARGVPPTPPNSIFEYSNIDVAISVPKKNEKKIKKSVDT